MNGSKLSTWAQRLRTTASQWLGRCRDWFARPASVSRNAVASVTGFFTAGKRREVADLRQRFLGCQLAIEALGDELERSFLTIGSQLDQLSEASDRLVAGSESLAHLAVGEHASQSVLATATHALQTALQENLSQETASQQFALTLVSHLEEIAKARRHEATLRSCVAPLKPIQTLFRVSAAGLDPDAQGTYSALAREIEQLNQQVTALLAQQFQGLADYHERIAQLVTRLNETHHSHEHALAEHTQQLTGSLDAMHTALTQSQGRDLRLKAAAHACHDQVGELVMAMQFQDITRQKLQHIETAFRRLAETLEDRDLDAATAADMHATATVQLAQLDTVEHELRDAEAKMTLAIARLLERVEELTAESVQMRQVPTLVGSDQGVVAGLLVSFGRLRQLVTSNAALRTEAHATLAPLTGLAANLTGAMGDISRRIKLIAINAEIQAVQTSKGTGLEVLSQHTCQISDEVAQLSDRAAIELDVLIASFTALLTSCRALHAQSTAQQNWLAGDGERLETQLADFRNAGEAQLGSVPVMGAELLEKLRATRAELTFCEPASNAFTALREPLADLAQLTAHARHAAHPVGGLTEELQSQYTMASEHVTLATALGGAAAPVPTAAAGTVELF